VTHRPEGAPSYDDPAARLADAEAALQAVAAGAVDALASGHGAGAEMISLERADSFFVTLVTAMQEATASLDSNGTLLYANPRFAELLGLPLSQVLGRTLAELTAKAGRAAARRLLAEAARGPASGTLELRRGNGRLVPVSVSAAPIAGERPEVCLVATDLTERRQAEDAIRRHAEGQEEIANLGRLALGGASLEELFDRSVGIASRVLSADCAWLVERLADTSGFVVRAAVGSPDERKGARIAPEEAPIASYAVRSRASILVEDWEDEPRISSSSKLRARGVRSSVATLIGDPDSPSGALAVHYTRPQGAPPDCLPFLEALANVLAEAIQARHAQDMLRHQALHDELTGLPNRVLFLDRVAVALARNERHPAPLAVLFIDLDHFKVVNDSLGHDAGDQLLAMVALRLASAIRPSDTLARFGGDEFAVLSDQLPSEVAATRIANHLMAALEEPIVLNGNEHVVSTSIGIAVSTSESSAAELLRDADAAMYHAKAAGPGRASLFDEQMRARVLGRVRTESALRAALASEDEIYVHYQPLVSLCSGQIVDAEALARWRHPDWGPVSPIEFIPVAEDSGLIHELGAQVIRRAARECAAWQDIPDFAGIAVNVSIRQLVQPDEVATLVRDALATEGITPGFLTLEITESLLIEQLDSALGALESLGDLGVRLSLDDFGTGYSSLSYLRDLPFDVVKIDRSLIRNIVETPKAAALAAAIIQMGHALDLQVIAEGVETPEQVALMKALGCDIAQGFYFATPLAPEQLTELLHNQPRWLPPTAKQTMRAPTQQLAPTARRPARYRRKPSPAPPRA
jgi:diguanylate cyclase (GGDEF)-like protein/PAS domain S-box-containing protein